MNQNQAEAIFLPLGGGMGMKRTCGAITGGFLVLGLGIKPQTPPLKEEKLASKERIQALTALIEEKHGSSYCDELRTNWENDQQVQMTKKEICSGIVQHVCELVYNELF